VPFDVPKDAGRKAARAARAALATRIVDLIQRNDPELLARGTEVGLVSRAYLEDPGNVRISEASPFEVLERTLAGVVDRRPSLLANLGLTAIQVLASGAEDDEGRPRSSMVVLFSDLEGFTRFTATHGDEAAAHLLTEHYRTAGSIVRSRGGRVRKRLGDGLLVSFTEPVAAVLAAVELVEAGPDPLRVRVGVHQGDVVVEGGEVLGHVVNVTARITEEANGGQILVSDAVRADLDDDLRGVTIRPAGKRRLAGIDEKVAVFEALRRA
jgi:class 3 adenylate cyclase